MPFGFAIEHLPGLARTDSPTRSLRKPGQYFKDDELDEGVGVILEHDRGAGDRCGYGRGVDLRPPSLVKRRSMAPPPARNALALIERKNGVRTEAGEGLVGKGRLGA